MEILDATVSSSAPSTRMGECTTSLNDSDCEFSWGRDGLEENQSLEESEGGSEESFNDLIVAQRNQRSRSVLMNISSAHSHTL